MFARKIGPSVWILHSLIKHNWHNIILLYIMSRSASRWTSDIQMTTQKTIQMMPSKELSGRGSSKTKKQTMKRMHMFPISSKKNKRWRQIHLRKLMRSIMDREMIGSKIIRNTGKNFLLLELAEERDKSYSRRHYLTFQYLNRPKQDKKRNPLNSVIPQFRS